MSTSNILIVEDDATIARFLELELKHAGFEPARA
jgi:DNA-binding response OmpR family regulator